MARRKPRTSKPKASPSKKKARTSQKKRPSSGKKSPRVKPRSYKIVTLSAKTGKEIHPRKGLEVFFALKSPSGKLSRLSTEYSQKYSKTDADGIRASFKEGSPSSFLVFRQYTKEKAFDLVDGKKVYRMNLKTGKPIYRYKLTRKRLTTKQAVGIYGTRGFIAPKDEGYRTHTVHDFPKGRLIRIPIQLPGEEERRPKSVVISGDLIKDTVSRIVPGLSLRQMVKLGIEKLNFDAKIIISRPKNPLKAGTAAYKAREAWIRSVFGEAGRTLTLSINRNIDRLVNFSDRLSVFIREVISNSGQRVTSLVNLVAAEKRADRKDEPGWIKIIRRPRNVDRMSARRLVPLRLEKKGRSVYPNLSPQNAGIKIILQLKALS